LQEKGTFVQKKNDESILFQPTKDKKENEIKIIFSSILAGICFVELLGG